MLQSTVIIAEIGWNFMGDMDLAEKMIVSAKDAGADIAKFQYWNPATLKAGAWDQDGRREIYNKAALTELKIKQIMVFCEKHKIKCLLSAFNQVGAEQLAKMGFREIKIPSHEISNAQLIQYSASVFDMVYLSTGASLTAEVITANRILKDSSTAYNLMHCVSAYPCPNECINLRRLNWLKELHQKVGFSDHTQNPLTPAIAVAMGATVIEKHFTIDKTLPGRDNKFALDHLEFKLMVEHIRMTETMLIDRGCDYQDSEFDVVENYRGRWG